MSAGHRSTSKSKDTRASMKQMLLPIDLSDAQYRILFILFLHANENGECFLSQKDMMRFMKLGKTAVWNACKELEAKGLIERNKKNHVSGEKPLATEYRFLWGRFAAVDLGHVRLDEPGQVRVDGSGQVHLPETQEPYEEPSTKNPKEEPKVDRARRRVVRKSSETSSRRKVVVPSSRENSLRNGVNKKPKGQVHVGEPGHVRVVDMGMERLRKFKQANSSVETGEPKTRWEQDNEWIV